ncbi:MAG TPA: hypothetical protein VJ742_10255, partial [Nitrososphaera sp.]|nr:hypothetical protein [Nitrososphaera sp.]
TATNELNSLIEKRQQLSDSGQSVLGTELEIGAAYSSQSALLEEILQKSGSIKKIMEEMPAFQDLEMAKATLGKGTAQAIEAPVQAGAFGRGATVGSVMMKQLAKSAGVGGMFDFSTLASPARTTESFLQKGITPQVSNDMFGMSKATGDIAVVSREAARRMLELKGAIPDSTQGLEQAIQTAQTGIVDVNQATGEAVITFYNNLTKEYTTLNSETWETIRGSLGEEAQKTGVFSKKAMAEAMENSRKILTLQFTGAMAGMRQPPQVDIGVARRADISAEQRAISMLQDEAARLGDIQTEIGNYMKEINEDMDAEGLKNGSQQINSLTKNILEMVI